MKFSMTRPVKIVMLGAGGTGGHIAPHLYRLLYSLRRPVRFILCDGNVVEEKNLVRQNFTPADLGENKAKVLAERYSAVFGLETEYVPSFVEDEDQLGSLLEPGYLWMRQPGHAYNVRVSELVILIGAVDNNKSRQLCHRVFYDRLSLSEKIRAGMEVSELMKRLTGRNYPVFVDNMESVDDLNNVRPTGQVIMAKCVSGAPLAVRPVRPIDVAQRQAA